MLSFSQVTLTTDYGRFKRAEINRRVQENAELATDLQEFGISLPVVVTSDFYIIDGQHRVELAERLNLAVPYMIAYSLTVEDARRLNSKRRNWQLIDYLNSYVKQGNKDYQFIKEVYERHKFKLGYILKLVNATPKALKNGDIKLSKKDKEVLQDRVNRLVKVWEINKYTRRYLAQQKILPALLKLLYSKNYDEERFIKQLTKYSYKLRSTSGGVEARQMLEDIYNHGSRNKKNVVSL